MRDVADEMINVRLFFLFTFIFFEDEGLWSAEAVVK